MFSGATKHGELGLIFVIKPFHQSIPNDFCNQHCFLGFFLTLLIDSNMYILYMVLKSDVC